MLLIVVRYLTWKWWLQMSPHYSLAVTKRSIEMVFLDVSKACLSRYYFIDGLIMPFEYKKVIVIFFCLWPTTYTKNLWEAALILTQSFRAAIHHGGEETAEFMAVGAHDWTPDILAHQKTQGSRTFPLFSLSPWNCTTHTQSRFPPSV